MGERSGRGALLAMVAVIRHDMISRDGIAVGATKTLTIRETEVLRLLAQLGDKREIARTLNIALPTADKHYSSLYRKLGARNRYQAVAIGIVRGLIE